MAHVIVARGPVVYGMVDTRVFGPYTFIEAAHEDAERIKKLHDWEADILPLTSSTEDNAVSDFVTDFITVETGRQAI